MAYADTTALSYWLNWRFGLSALVILISIILSSILIWKYEFSKKSARKNQPEGHGILYEDEPWRTCVKGINPVWLLGFRMFAFSILVGLITANLVTGGFRMLLFYTQWTFILVTIYFGMATSLSIYGCFFYNEKACASLDEERGTYRPPILDIADDETSKSLTTTIEEQAFVRQPARVWGYVFQILFQMCTGAAALTDTVYWLVIYPFLTSRDYNLSFLMVSMHSINAVFLLGDIMLNCMRFPMFRIAYFALWTSLFVIFQWTIHACVSFWWPYPFLDLSSPNAPLWYMGVGLMHIPCYCIFALIIKLKHFWLSRTFAETYQSI